MNRISIVEEKDKGIEIDFPGHNIKLPSEKSRLRIKIYVDDGSPPAGKKVLLLFRRQSDSSSAKEMKVVKNVDGKWDYFSVLPADEQGEVNFELNLPARPPYDLDIYALLEDEQSHAENQNQWTFHLTVKATERTSEVDRLNIVSGDRQFISLDGTEFMPLVVQAFHQNKEVNNAHVKFSVNSPVTSETVRIETEAVPTGADGKTHVLLVKGAVPGIFTVTASTTSSVSVTFHLALGPNSDQLEISCDRTDLSLHGISQDSAEYRAFVRTRGTTQGWPYVHGQAYITPGDIAIFRPGDKNTVDLISDLTGLFKPKDGLSSLNVVAVRRGQNILRTSAIVPPAIIINLPNDIPVIVTAG